jgi:hypothetical protein
MNIVKNISSGVAEEIFLQFLFSCSPGDYFSGHRATAK